MPTAAAVAAAAATAKIQAMEAVTNTAAAFGLAKDISPPSSSMLSAVPPPLIPVGVAAPILPVNNVMSMTPPQLVRKYFISSNTIICFV